MKTGNHAVDLGAAWSVVENAVQREEIPGAVALVLRNGIAVLHEAAGWAALQPERRPMKTDTIFDLASLTKPLATAPLVLKLAELGEISLDDPVCRYLPAMRRFAHGGVTVRQLLTHTGGLPAWTPLYVWARTPAGALEIIAQAQPAHPPGSGVVYSCLGYILLGMLVEQLTADSLDDVASRLLFDPLDLKDTRYGSCVERERCAWTERGNRFEQESVAAAGLSFDAWREGYIAGNVHDGNAWYVMGGVSGNAGLFGTAHDVGVLGHIWLNRGQGSNTRVLSEQTVSQATLDCTPRLNEARGLGWQINRPARGGRAAKASAPLSAGVQLGARAFGHTGFTGTSIWLDPDLDLVAVLLTNRVHPTSGDSAPITALRCRFHDAVVTAVRTATPSEPPAREATGE